VPPYGIPRDFPAEITSLPRLTSVSIVEAFAGETLRQFFKSQSSLSNVFGVDGVPDELTNLQPFEVGLFTNLEVVTLFRTALVGQLPAQFFEVKNLFLSVTTPPDMQIWRGLTHFSAHATSL
jgi:hypothetical protein